MNLKHHTIVGNNFSVMVDDQYIIRGISNHSLNQKTYTSYLNQTIFDMFNDMFIFDVPIEDKLRKHLKSAFNHKQDFKEEIKISNKLDHQYEGTLDIEGHLIETEDKNMVLLNVHPTENEQYIQTLYELAIKSGHIGVFYYDIQKYSQDYFVANDIYAEMFGLEPNKDGLFSTEDFLSSILEIEAELTENNVLEAVSDLFEGRIQGTDDDLLKVKHIKTGEIRYYLSSSKVKSRYKNGKPRNFGGVVIDITSRVEKEKLERKKTLMDNLTELGNNRKLEKDLEDAKDGYGIFIDLDQFKKINDTYGHLAGDELIIEFSNILRQIASEQVKIYRLYGDEFFVLVEDKDITFSQEVIDKIDQITADFNATSKYEIGLGSSKGMYPYHSGDDMDEFIKQCDYEMYREKIKKSDKNK